MTGDVSWRTFLSGLELPILIGWELGWGGLRKNCAVGRVRRP